MSKRKTTDEFIQDAIAVHGDRYDYSLVEYINWNTKVKISCKEHGIFLQIPQGHLSGKGCTQCSIKKMADLFKKSQDRFIQDAIAIHGDKYDYSIVDYKSAHHKIKITCNDHGVFTQTPTNHLSNHGCTKCGMKSRVNKRKKSQDRFIKDAKKIHGDVYDYTLVEYMLSIDKVNIICSQHGIFEQSPNNHLRGRGCPKCKSIISKPEIQWLDSLGIPNDKEHRQVRMNKYIVDGYDPTTNTVYEFHGDFWHGNPNTTDHTKSNPVSKKPFKQLYEETIKKETQLKESGFNLITMWESDWKAIKTGS